MLAQDQFVRDHIEAPDTVAVRAVNHPVASRSDPKHDGRRKRGGSKTGSQKGISRRASGGASRGTV